MRSKPCGLAVFVLAALAFVGIAVTGCISSNTEEPDHPSLKISREDEDRVNEIIQNTMTDPTYLTPGIQEEFWTLLQKGEPTEQDIADYRNFMAGVTTTYQTYYWEDARESLQLGEPHKSEARASYEQHLVEIGAMARPEIERNDNMMRQIALGDPFEMEGQTVAIDVAATGRILQGIQTVVDRLDKLFTPP